MPWLGDIFIPWITDKDTSISRNVIEKNFVGEPPQVFEINNDLESGSYSLVLNETIHERNESFREQMDSVVSMPTRHGAEFPFSLAGDTGHLVVNSASATITPSKEIRTGEAELRFLDDGTFRPSFKVEAVPESSDFSPTPEESVLPLSVDVESVSSDLNGSRSPAYTLTSEDGDIDLYTYADEEVIEYDRNSATYTIDERKGPVRVYDVESGYDSNYTSYGGEKLRVYSGEVAVDYPLLTNGLIQQFVSDTDSPLYNYDSSSDSWDRFGYVMEGSGTCYLSEEDNYNGEVTSPGDYSSSLLKGLPVVKFSGVSGSSTFTFSSDYSLNSGTDNGYYYSTTDGNSNEIFVLRTSSDGSFAQSNGEIRVENLTSSSEYTFYVGYVPDSMSVSDLARYIFNRGEWKRNLVQR